MTGPVVALVLAGSRRGARDPVARAAGVPVKALVPLAGRPLLAHVLAALTAAPSVGRLAVVGDPRLRARFGEKVRFLPPRPGLIESVRAGLAELGLPLLVTTADHPLLTPRAIERFLAAARARDADLAAAVVPRSVFARRFPHNRRTWWRFRDDGYTGANLFLLRTPAAGRLLDWWQGLEDARKRPWKVVAALGPGLLIRYLVGSLTLGDAAATLSCRLGVRFAAVPLHMPELAVDVDRPDDLRLAAAILATRAGEAHA